jgi:hypothetical protein
MPEYGHRRLMSAKSHGGVPGLGWQSNHCQNPQQQARERCRVLPHEVLGTPYRS